MGKRKNNKNVQPTNGRADFDTYRGKIAPKAISRARADVATWKRALRQADSIDEPSRFSLMRLYEDIMLDSHLSSQIDLRAAAVIATTHSLYRNKKRADEETELLDIPLYDAITEMIFEAKLFGHSLVEISLVDGKPHCELLPRTNVIPERGEIMLDYNKYINYREVREYGKTIIEFGKNKDYGLLNKAVPHVLFKRFAGSCWSEACEVCGIPPRYIKTDTTNAISLGRAEQMMQDVGAAAWWILDKDEEFGFASSPNNATGDIYKNLAAYSNNELSMLISGAVAGQDTKNGSNSKEESSQELMERIYNRDRKFVETAWNNVVIPALVSLGYLPKGLKFQFEKEVNLEKLWAMTKDVMEHKNVPCEWIKETFGIECEDKPAVAEQASGGAQLSANSFFE